MLIYISHLAATVNSSTALSGQHGAQWWASWCPPPQSPPQRNSQSWRYLGNPKKCQLLFCSEHPIRNSSIHDRRIVCLGKDRILRSWRGKSAFSPPSFNIYVYHLARFRVPMNLTAYSMFFVTLVGPNKNNCFFVYWIIHGLCMG